MFERNLPYFSSELVQDVHPLPRSLVRSLVGSFARSLPGSFVRSFFGSFAPSFVRLLAPFAHTLVCWFFFSFVGSFVRSFFRSLVRRSFGRSKEVWSVITSHYCRGYVHSNKDPPYSSFLDIVGV